MLALKSSGWEFIVKAIEFLDDQLGVEYISTPMPLLWKVARESYHCTSFAMKTMVTRLLKVLFLLMVSYAAECTVCRASGIRGICY